MNNKELADLIFPNVKNYTYYEEKYPKRDLPEGTIVTRFAPSPTGFVHIGGIYQSLIAKLMTKDNGIFFVRIEDTDQKREIEDGVKQIMDALKDFDLSPDEYIDENDVDHGNYGPYKQSLRKDIYQSYAKKFIEEGNAYPCFCTPEELDEIRSNQEKAKERTGYYGKWTRCRNMPIDMAAEKIKNGDPYIIRFKSPGNPDKKIRHTDVIKGNVDFPENDQDIVIIKSDGLPTYHFAHLVDDHLMGTSMVIRADEWLASVPLHLQLFYVAGFKAPKYAHIAPMMKTDGEGKRKLSKRKDPESAVTYYKEEGIPKEAVLEYLMNIANSNFEIWRKQNPDKSMYEFNFDIKKMGVSGALFDMVKMLDVSKNVISKFTTEEVYNSAYNWAKEYDKELKEMLDQKEYSMKVLGIERGNVKPRKDIAKWSDVKENVYYMYDEKFIPSEINYEFQKITDEQEVKKLVKLYFEKYYDENDDKQVWFNKMKDLAESQGYAREVKDFKANPDKYPGHVGDVSTVIRVAITGRCNTPDLCEILKVLGKESIEKRVEKLLNNYKS